MKSVWIGWNYKQGEKEPVIPREFHGAKHIEGEALHPAGHDPFACTKTGYGPWYDKIAHFLPDRAPSSAGEEIQAEYYIPYKNFPNAVRAMFKIRKEFNHLVRISEMRMMCQDNLPMSQAKDGPVIGLHCTMFKEPE